MKLRNLVIEIFKLVTVQYLFIAAGTLVLIVGYLFFFTPVGNEINSAYNILNAEYLNFWLEQAPLIYPAEFKFCEKSTGYISNFVANNAQAWQNMVRIVKDDPNLQFNLCTVEPSSSVPHLAKLTYQENTNPSFQTIGFIFFGVAIVVMLIFYKLDPKFSLLAFLLFATFGCLFLFGHLLVG